MRKLFYPSLAASNLKKNAKYYVPYLITCICSVAMYYIINALSTNEGLQNMMGGDIMQMILSFGSGVVAFFSVCFLFYTGSFLVKHRKKEFGLLNILGMEKKHISKMIAYESLYVYVISLILGLASGILLFKLAQLAIMKIFELDIKFGFEIPMSAIISTLVLFSVIFFLIFLNSLRQIHLSKPIELLKGSNTGEKEPKTKWILTILGLLCLGGGYYISITTTNPADALFLFFLAVILVIVGTYCLFIACSITVLKMLRKNKKYYYKTNHFISISGMIYRMKQNAAGLATICILVTMVLVMLSSTSSLYIGMNDALTSRYPREFLVEVEPTESAIDTVEKTAEKVLGNQSLEMKNSQSYSYLGVTALQNGNNFEAFENYMDMNSIRILCLIPLEDFNRLANSDVELKENEVLVYSNRDAYGENEINIFKNEFSVQKTTVDFETFNIGGGYNADMYTTFFVIVPDMQAINNVYEAQLQEYGEAITKIRHIYTFDIEGSKESLKAFSNEMDKELSKANVDYMIESRTENRANFLSLYGGLFFLGIFLGVVFIMATVLIIYYKQISEGYDDKERFKIMQNVGLSHKNVKRSIHSQILTMFFLPLVVACIHIAFAFPVITRMLSLLNLTNTNLFLLSTAVSILIFAFFYVIIYKATANVYYKIVEDKTR